MADQWDSLLDQHAPGQQKDPWDAALDQFDPNPQAPPEQNRGLAGDLVTDFKRGVQQIPGAVTGLLDIPYGLVFGERRVGRAFEKMGEATGFQPGKWADEAQAEYSAGRQQANQEVDQAWERGVGSGMAATLANPGRLTGMVVESLPSMVAGGVAGRGALAVGRGLGLVANPASAAQRLAQGAVAGGAGEGAMIAGQMSDNLSDDVGGREGALASLGAGAVGGFLGVKGGRLAQRMGVVDPETAIAAGMRTAGDGVGALKLASRVGRGALAEGVFEEMPQSVQEQMWQNWAEDDPIFQGVARAGFEGLLAGGLMGGAFNIPGQPRVETQPPANNVIPERTLALPAPGNSSYVETGTPSDLILAADTERANAVAQAQANADAIYAARDEFEAARADATINLAQPALPGMPMPLFAETTETRSAQELLAEYSELRYQALAPEVRQHPELGQQLAERAKQLRQELGAQGVPWQVVDPAVMENRINTLETEIRNGLDRYKNVLLSDPDKAPKLAERIRGMQNELEQFKPFLEQASTQGSFAFGDATTVKAPKVKTSAPTDLLGGNDGSRNRVASNASLAQNSSAVQGTQSVGSAGNLAPMPAVGSGGGVDAGASVPGATASAPAGVSGLANTSLIGGTNVSAPAQVAAPAAETNAAETGAPAPIDRVTAFKQSNGVKRTDKRIGQFLQELDTARDSGQITQEEHAEYEQKLADAWKQKNKAAVTAHNAVAKDYATKIQERAKPANIHQAATQSVPDEQRFVQNLMGSLSPQERRVLELYHFDKQTMEDIGDTLSNEEGREKAYTRARIQQIHAAAVGKIKQAATQLGVPPERIDAYFGSENNSLQGGADVQTVSAAELAQSGAAMHTPGAATNPAQQGDDVPVADVAGNQELGDEATLVGEFGESDQFDVDSTERQFSREEAVADDGTYELTVEEVDAMEVIDSFNLQTTPSGDKITAQDVEATKAWWDDMDGTVLNDRFLPAMVNIYVALDTGRINDREFGAHYAEISKLNAKASGPVQTTDGTDRQVSVEQDAGVQSQSGEGAAVRGTEDARESPEATNPIERRVANLLPQLGERQAAAVSKLVRRFQGGEISIERLGDELQNYEDQVSEGVKFSRADKPQGTTERDIRAKLQGLFHSKSRFDAKVTVFATADDVPVELRDQAAMDASVDAADVEWEGVQGFAMDGKVYLIAENIAPGRELAVFLHEVGVHLGMKNLLGQGNYDKLVEQIKTWAESRKDTQEAKLARKALYRIMDAEEAVGEDMSQPDFDDELIAYFVEEAVLAGINPQALHKARGPIAQWFRTLWASVKAALRKFGLDRVDTLTAQNLVDMAYGAADLTLEGESVEVGGQPAKFSIARPQLPTFAEATDRVNDLLIGAKDGLDKLKLGFLTLEQLSWQSKSDKVKAYVSTMTKIQERSQGIVELASKIDQEWAGLSDKDSAALSKLMLASTKAGYDPSVKGAKPEGAEQTMIQQAFNDLKRRSTTAAELYSKVRDFYKDRYEQRRAILMDAANKAKLNGRDLEKIKEMYSKVPQPYFPMMRIGNYYAVGMSPRLAALEAKHKEGTITPGELAERGRLRKQEQHYITSSYDTLAEAQRAVRGYQQAGMTAYANEAKEQLTQAAVKLPGFAQMEAYMKAEVPDAALRDQLTGLFTKMVLEMTPENSAMKSMLVREGIAGAHQDMRQVFAKSAITQAHYISRLEYNHQLMGDLAAIHKEGEGDNIGGTRIYNELVARTKLAAEVEDHPIVDKLMNASYLAHLGASPAYWLLNATQVPMITFPWLGARFGFGRSSTALAAAFKDAKDILKTTLSEKDGWRSDIDWSKRFGKDSNEHKLLEEMNRRNLLSITMEHDLGATARMGGSKYGLGSFAKLVNTPVRLIEYANRATTALAAYRLEMAKSGNHDEAVEVAAKAVSMTQLNYSGLNTPRHMQSVLGSKTLARMMMQFRKFQQGMLYLTVSSINDAIRATGKDAAETKQLRLEARKTLLGLFATTGVMAGTLGTPMFATVAAIANAIANAGGDDDEPWDFETELRNFYADVLGKDVGLAFAKGIPAAFGVDLSKRMGMGDIGSPLPFVRAGENVQATAGNIALGLGGAPVGMMVGIADGMSQVAGGDVLKGVEKVVPLKLVKDIGKSIRYGDEGMTDRNGNVILPSDQFDPWDLTLRAMGLGTTKESEYYDANNAVQTAKEAATGTRNKLLRKYAEARLANEPLGDIQAEIAEFNQRHPQKGVRIDASSMLRSVQNRRNMAKERDGSGVRAGKANAPYLDNARFALGT